MKKTEYYLQGDVIIIKEKLPEDFKNMTPVKDSCLATGKATGHSHKLFGSDYDLREKDGIKYLKVTKPTDLRHEEHKEIKIPKGEYTIKIQREYDHFSEEIRSVMD